MAKPVIVAMLTVAAFAACEREPFVVPGKAVPLANGFTSHSSPAEVRMRPDVAGLPWRVIEGRELQSGERPRFIEYVAVIPGYTFGRDRGDLRLDFVNGKLFAVWFYPANLDAFVAENAIRTVDAASETRIRIGSDHNGRRYVSWEDARIYEALQEWTIHST